jgi:hypothetical protein
MLSTMNPVNFLNTITMDERNKRLVVDGYAQGTKPSSFSRHLIDLAIKKNWRKYGFGHYRQLFSMKVTQSKLY